MCANGFELLATNTPLSIHSSLVQIVRYGCNRVSGAKLGKINATRKSKPEPISFRIPRNRHSSHQETKRKRIVSQLPGNENQVLDGWTNVRDSGNPRNHGKFGCSQFPGTAVRPVHANDRTRRIVGFCVGFEHFLHAGRKLGIRFRRNHPVPDLAIRHAVFFSVRRTVS